MDEPLHVLLIEDSEEDALLVTRVLQRGGFIPHVERVQTAQALLAALPQHPWDVIIADYHLPSFNAPTALEILKRSGRDIPFLITSGTVGEQAAVEMMRAGACDYVMKDNLERLPEAVRRELRESQVRAERTQTEAAIQSLIEGTASVTGIDFFHALVKQIGISLHVDYVLVNELVGTTLHSLAYWANGSLQPETNYSILQTPCEIVLREGRYVCLNMIQEIFPDDPDLAVMRANSYLGIALCDANGRAIGNLCILNMGNLRSPERTEAILQIFANRAGAEIERQRAILALQQVNQKLETIVEQRTAELLMINDQLMITNVDLARATRLKDEFLANMSHELRTPLNAILGLSESLQEQIYGSLNANQYNAIVTIESSGRHLLSLINDILDLSKIASGKLELRKEPVDIWYLSENSILFVKEQAVRKQIQLSSVMPEALQNSEIVVDELRVRQALINLLANAVKFTPDGGSVSLEITVADQLYVPLTPNNQQAALLPQTMFLLFHVIDTGIGIDQMDIERLFHPFVQIDSNLNRQREGTGLGLALVKQIAELHGGMVSVESQLGVGSHFTLALPYAITESSLSLPIEQHMAPFAPSAKLSSMMPMLPIMPITPIIAMPVILIAEDNEMNISTFSDYLTMQNFRLLVAKNGFEAIEIAQSYIPDLILMDVQMPGMDGLEAMRAIRADSQISHIPIIALTALAMPGDEANCLEAGANAYLAKPIRLKQLTELIRQLLVK